MSFARRIEHVVGAAKRGISELAASSMSGFKRHATIDTLPSAPQFYLD